MIFTSPADIENEARKLWNGGRILRAHIEGEPLFPLSLRLRRPDRRMMSERFDEVRSWIRALHERSKPQRGFGYEIGWEEIEHRQLGRNRVPAQIVIPTREDALRLAGKERQSLRFEALAKVTLDAFPELRSWLAKRPLVVLEHEREWERILAVLRWFREHPRPGLYLRQIDIPNVDTKFIELRRTLFMELLDGVLGSVVVRDAAGVRNFETRYGLLKKPGLVRFRILDPKHRIGGLSDISTPFSELADFELSVSRVFITENEVNGLAFPDAVDSAVIFGLGYGLERLGELGWLRRKAIHYWGDLDTHGFAILDRLRALFPNTQSLLMDRETLLAHRHMWVREDSPHPGPLARLSEAEQHLFEDLVSNRLGERVRLEQERLAFGWVQRAIAEVPWER